LEALGSGGGLAKTPSHDAEFIAKHLVVARRAVIALETRRNGDKVLR
jgi:hypothetical protein